MLPRNNTIFLTREELRGLGVESNTISVGLSRARCRSYTSWQTKHVGPRGEEHIDYSTIPERTIRLYNLPSTQQLIQRYQDEQRLAADEEADDAADRAAYQLSEELRRVRDKDVRGYYKQYLAAYGHERAMRYGEQHSLWARLVELRQQKPRVTVAALFPAYNYLQPGDYKSAASFGNALRAAIAHAGNLAQFIRHGNEGNKNASNHTAEHELLIRKLASQGRGYDAAYIFKKANQVCELEGWPQMEDASWVRKYLARPDVKADIGAYRYGDSYARTQLPYLRMETALYANDQWQIDGWEIPFYYIVKVEKDGKIRWSYQKLKIVAVLDAHSNKLVGYAFGKQENTDVIMHALRNAVRRTGKLPAEIVSDNHAFNQTKESAYFKEQLKARGTEWTKTMNPQYKSLVERFFDKFNNEYCKPVQGWTGASPHDRRRNVRPKPELKTEYLKAAHTYESGEIIALVARLVETYHEAPLTTRTTRTPNEVYEASEQPNAHEVDAADLMHLFWKTTRVTVRRGMVTLERNGKKHTYTLSAEDYHRWNTKEVEVRYDDDFAQALLLHPTTGATIDLLERDVPTHGAKVNQQPDDMSRLAKRKHLQQQIRQVSRKSNQDLQQKVEEAHGVLPLDLLDPITSSKDVRLSARAEYEVQQLLQEHGVNEDLLVPVQRIEPLRRTQFSPDARPVSRAAGGPFTPEPTLRRIGRDEGWEEDE